MKDGNERFNKLKVDGTNSMLIAYKAIEQQNVDSRIHVGYD